MIEIEIPELFGAERTAWHAVLDLANADLPRWVLAGGLMVHLHLYEARYPTSSHHRRGRHSAVVLALQLEPFVTEPDAMATLRHTLSEVESILDELAEETAQLAAEVTA